MVAGCYIARNPLAVIRKPITQQPNRRKLGQPASRSAPRHLCWQPKLAGSSSGADLGRAATKGLGRVPLCFVVVIIRFRRGPGTAETGAAVLNPLLSRHEGPGGNARLAGKEGLEEWADERSPNVRGVRASGKFLKDK